MSIGSWREAARSHLAPVALEDRSLPHLDRRKEEHLGNNSENYSWRYSIDAKVYVRVKSLKYHIVSLRNESTNNREISWMERPNLVALGVGLQSKTEQSTAWQILPSQTNVR